MLSLYRQERNLASPYPFSTISLVRMSAVKIIVSVSERNSSQWNDWKWQLRNRITHIHELQKFIRTSPEEEESLEEARKFFDFGVSPYYANLMDPQDPKCPIRLQSIPRKGELIRFPGEVEDPLAEETNMPVRGVTHRYPDRALWYLSHSCAVYCRFCTRKRKVSQSFHTPRREDWESALNYFRETKTMREVILSGGDPFSLADNQLNYLLSELKKISHLKSIRIHSRHPVTLPMRITSELCSVLAKYFPLTLVTHFNHPKEITPESKSAVSRLIQQGHVSILNQSVLLRDINDSVEVLEELNYGLVEIGIKPYYLHQCDEIFGISHFQVPIEKGIEIYRRMRGRMSGITVPLYVADLKGGGGKIPIFPDYLEEIKENSIIFRNYKGELYEISDGNTRPELHNLRETQV